jgi:hypothetical protein
MGSVGMLLGLKEDKMRVAPKEWRNHNLPVLVGRCESDVILLQELYTKTKHLIGTINL